MKTIGRVATSAPVRSVGKALKKEATKAAVETALEALEGQPVGRKATTFKICYSWYFA